MRFHALDEMWSHMKRDQPPMAPCPFCGNPFASLEGLRQVSVVCDRCKAEGPPSSFGSDPYTAIGEAVHKWNTRNPTDSTVIWGCGG